MHFVRLGPWNKTGDATRRKFVRSEMATENQFRKASRNRSPLTAGAAADTFQLTIGGLAQLGERLAGSQKVSGSSPLSSTFSRSIMLEAKPQIDGAFFLRPRTSAFPGLIPFDECPLVNGKARSYGS
jgi:hypothetical protein